MSTPPIEELATNSTIEKFSWDTSFPSSWASVPQSTFRLATLAIPTSSRFLDTLFALYPHNSATLNSKDTRPGQLNL